MRVLEGVSYDSPEEAARGARASAEVLALDESPDGRYAVAVVDKGRPGTPYLLQVICERQSDGWRGGWDTNGHGYTALPDTRVVTAWGEAPRGARSVSVRWRGQDHELPVRNGYFLFVDWRMPEAEFDSSDEFPELL